MLEPPAGVAALDAQLARDALQKKRLSWVTAAFGRGRDPAAGAGAAFGRAAGLNFSSLKRMRATSSPCWSRYSVRWVTKCPTPRAVFFSSETSSITVSERSQSPGRR
jgi:hypothetical protein